MSFLLGEFMCERIIRCPEEVERTRRAIHAPEYVAKMVEDMGGRSGGLVSEERIVELSQQSNNFSRELLTYLETGE